MMCAGRQRKRRAAPRQRRQAATEDEEDVEAEFNPDNPYQVSHMQTRSSSTVVFTRRRRLSIQI